MRKFNEMVDQLLHEQLQQTNNYKELCAHMSRRDKVLFKATTTKLENVYVTPGQSLI
jgi:hypothetical protein